MGLFKLTRKRSKKYTGTVELFDKIGNKHVIDKEEYVKRILPDNLKDAWKDSDALYNLIIMSIDDGLEREVLQPAKRLYEIDNNKERGVITLAIAYLKNNNPNEAKTVLEKHISSFGPSGVLLTNLAKAEFELGEKEKYINTLRWALEMDPNQDNALDWWGAIHNEQDGHEGFLEAIKVIAKISGAWRPQLWLGREYLKNNQPEKAVEIYQKSLADSNYDNAVLMMGTGDLGEYGYSEFIIPIFYYVYKPHVHHPSVGFNILNACLEQKEKEKGLYLVNIMLKAERYDVIQYLNEFKSKLEKL